MALTEQRTLLLVEDEPLVATVEKKTLEGFGYSVVVVNSGEKAVETVGGDPDGVDLILMDIDLGDGIDGTEAAEQILARCEIPIVFLSSHTEPEYVERTEGITSYGYIVKNSGVTVLHAAIKMAFRLFEAKQTITKKEEQLEHYFDSSLDLLCIATTDGDSVRLNPEWETVLGYPFSELQGRHLFEFVHDEDKAATEEVFARLRNQEEIESFENRCRCRNGAYRRIEWRARAIDDMVYAVGRDVTERRDAELRLRENEAFKTAVVEASPQPIIAFDTDGCVTVWNDAAERVFGWQTEEVLGMDSRNTDLWGDPKAGARFIETVQTEGSTHNYEARLRKRDGTWADVLISGERIRFDGREVILTVVTPVSEVTSALDRMEAAERRSRALIENGNDIVMVLLPDKTVEFAAGNLHDGLSWSSQSLVGRPFPEAIDNGDRDEFETLFEAVLNESKEPASLVFHLQDDKGGRRSFEGVLTNVLADPAVQGVILNAWEVTERDLLEQSLQRQVKNLQALRKIDLAIISTVDLRVVLDTILVQVTAELDADAAAIYLMSDDGQSVEPVFHRGFQEFEPRQPMTRRKGLFERLIKAGGHLHVADLADLQAILDRPQLVTQERFIDYHAELLVAKGERIGVLEVFRRTRRAFSKEQHGFLQVLAGQTAIAIDYLRLFERLQWAQQDLVTAYDETLEGWVTALDLRDRDTEGHSLRVTELTVAIAQRMGIHGDRLVHVRRGALLHDIGKMGVPDEILHKPSGLTDEEFSIMARHPQYSYSWLAGIEFLRPALAIPYCHHERWDGSGYPRGISGKVIPVEARIFSVVDAWDAMIHDRPYRKALAFETAREELLNHAGTQFDPQVVEVFLEYTNSMAGSRE